MSQEPDQHGAELVHLREQLREAQKLAVIGRLAGGISHDFNNIVSASLLHLNLLQQDPNLSAGQRESLGNLERETARGASLTRQLMAFSRCDEGVRRTVLNFNGLVGDLQRLLQRLTRDNVGVVLESSGEEAWVQGDAGSLEQMVMMLCLLVEGDLERGGVIHLKICVEERAGGDANATLPQVCLHVTATPHDPGTSTRQGFAPAPRAERQAWFGIEAVEAIVHRHEGRLVVPATRGPHGAFKVSLPLAVRPSEISKIPAHADGMEGGSETILLVEDEAFLRRVTASCLRRLGYAVLAAGDGGRAMELWSQHQDKIDLLLADCLLPGPETGLDLARRMKRAKASLHVIVSSGYSMDLTAFSEEDRRQIFHLKKPYAAGDLAKFVRECLDAKPAPSND